MARPKSMTDFSNLIDPSYSLSRRERPRKKSSISLAAGLIMASEAQSPKSATLLPSQVNGIRERSKSDGLFYAYIQKSDSSYSQSLPFTVAFASAAVANQWWDLIKREHPRSERPSPQLFILRSEHSEDILAQLQENPRFYHLRHRWFFLSSSTSEPTSVPVIPLQDYSGNPLSSQPQSATPTPVSASDSAVFPRASASKEHEVTLSKVLDTLTTQTTTNAAQVDALSTAQSTGLRHMQDIAESHSAQIKALADGQARLQALLESNATHFLALSNAAFASQEAVKSALKTNANQIGALAEGQKKMATTCSGLMKTMDGLGGTVKKVGDEVVKVSKGWSPGLNTAAQGVDSMRMNKAGLVEKAREAAISVSPSPRKLNRRIKSVWYEYEDGASAVAPAKKEKGMGALETRSKTPGALRS